MRYYSKYTLFFIISVFLLVGCSRNRENKPEIDNGILDLSTWDFQNSNIAKIVGNAEFYWNEFFTIDEIRSGKTSSCFVDIINSWNNQRDENCKFPAKGYATYHFKVQIPENDLGKQFILRPNHFIAYSSQIYVNNQLVGHNGSVGRSKKDNSYKPSRNTTCSPFVADSSVLDVVIWVANYHHFRGGVFNELELGYATEMIVKREKAITYDLIVIISLLIMFFYHFLLYFVNTKEKTSLFFSLTCLVFAFDLSFQDTMAFFLVFPNVGFAISSFLHLSLPYMIPSSFLFFLYALFPNEVSKTIRNIAGVITLILVSLTIFNIPSLNSLISKPHLAYLFLIVVYVYFVAIKAVIKKREGASLFLIAYLIFSICAINDILFVFEFIHTASLVASGLIVFVFLLSILQGRRSSNMSKRNIKLTNYLKELNKDLGNKVKIRTRELNLSLEKLQKLNEFKEDMTNMIIHDLKTSLSTIINVKLIKNCDDERSIVQQAGYTMLNLVQNVLDIYKYENAEVELSMSEIELIEIINKAIEEVGYLAKLKLLKLQINKNTNCLINADKHFIRRVIVNLLSNSIKFSPTNGTIEISANIDQNNVAKIAISNQGVAIPEEKQKMIFEKFGNAESKSDDNKDSTGLGLAFCKLAVEAHKGKIGVVSEKESGVEFWFTLPNSYNVENKERESDFVKNSEMLLTVTDKEYLAPFTKELIKYRIYEITDINNVLKKIEKKSKGIEAWLSKMNEILYSENEDIYNSLIRF